MGRDAMRRNHSQAQHHVLQMMDSEPPPPAYSAAAAAASWLRRDVGTGNSENWRELGESRETEKN